MSSENPKNRYERKHAARVRSRKHRHAKKTRFFIFASVFFLLAAAIGTSLFLQRHSLMKRYRAHQAQGLLEDSNSAKEAGDTERRIETIGKAYRLDPSNPEIIRAVATIQQEAGANQSAAAFLGALEKTGRATSDDQRQLLELYLGQGRFGDAAKLASGLLEEFPEDAALLELAAHAALALNRPDEALTFLERARKIEPDNLELQLLYARQRLQSPLADVRAVAWESIFGIAESDPEGDAGLNALRVIHNQRRNLLVPLEKYFELFKNHPLRPSEAAPSLALLAWQFDLAPERREEIARNAMTTWFAADLTDKELDTRIEWLNAQALSETVLRFLTQEENIERGENLIAATLGALVLEKKFDEADAIVEEMRETGRKSIAAGCKAVLLYARGRSPREVDDEIRHATLLAVREPNPENLLRIGYMALQFERYNEAIHAFDLATDAAPVPAYRALAAIAEKQNDLDALLQYIEALATAQPGDKAIEARRTYLRLLLQIELEAAAKTASRLHASDPLDAEYILLQAFAHYRYREFERATDLARGIDPEQLPERYRAALVAIYHAANDAATAAAVTDTIVVARLGDAERLLLAPDAESSLPAPEPEPEPEPLPEGSPNPYLPPRKAAEGEADAG